MSSTVHVLVVDDSPTDREAICRALRHETEFRYRFTEVDNSEQALATIAEGNVPDLLIIDYALPGMDGMEAVRRLRGDKRLPPCPVVLLTGTSPLNSMSTEKVLENGIQDFFAKSAISSSLLPRVARNAIDRYRLTSRLVASEIEARTARLRADDANRAKSMFLASMSHELRTPLTAVLGLTDLLLENPRAADAERMLEMIRSNGRHLAELLNDMLDLARIEAGGIEIDLEAFDVRSLIESLCGLLRYRANDHGLRLDLRFENDLPPRIRSDATRLRQILMNLLSNAIKFTSRGAVTVTVSALRDREPPALRIVVADTGIGIEAEQLERIFDPFVQVVRGENEGPGGVGLGLAISRALAKALGGDLRAESQPGAGSEFTLTVSMGSVATEGRDGVVTSLARRRTPVDPEGIDYRWTDRRFLVAEDTPANRYLIRRMLQSTGADLAFVEDGCEALARIEATDASKPFDLVLMDMQMPRLDGFEATTELRRRGFDLPIVALTAAAMEGDRERCLNAGCTDYVVKPIDRRTLLSTVAAHLASRPGEGA